jgi:hypothetical protein
MALVAALVSVTAVEPKIAKMLTVEAVPVVKNVTILSCVGSSAERDVERQRTVG